VVTCKIKHLQNVRKNVLEVATRKIKHFYNIFMSTAQQQAVDGSKTLLHMFLAC